MIIGPETMRGGRIKFLEVSALLCKSAISGETIRDSSGKVKPMFSDRRKDCLTDKEIFEGAKVVRLKIH